MHLIWCPVHTYTRDWRKRVHVLKMVRPRQIHTSARYLRVWIDQDEWKIAAACPVGRVKYFIKGFIYKAHLPKLRTAHLLQLKIISEMNFSSINIYLTIGCVECHARCRCRFYTDIRSIHMQDEYIICRTSTLFNSLVLQD